VDKERSQQFMQKVVGDVGTALAAGLVLVGQQTGLFKAMAGAGAMTAEQLVAKTGIHARYVEEWLGAMVCNAYVEHDPVAHTFTFPDEHALFLTDDSTEFYLGGLFTGLPGLMSMVPRLVQAFEKGSGITFAEFGEGLPVALEQMNRPVYENRLTRTWLPTMPHIVAKLQAGGRAIDIGCGTGVVAMTLAKAYPAARIEALDFDARSIAIAKNYAEQAGLAGRIQFTQGRAQDIESAPGYDLISTFDVIHDLPEPLAVLRRIRECLAPGGSYLMVEPRMDHELNNNRTAFGKLLYGMSCLHCVPQSLSQGGPGLGACWGPKRAQELAMQAGFASFTPLPVRSPVLAFYELRASIT
jgi:SAM-dependent methyltransferase